MTAPNRIDLLRQSDILVGLDFVRVSPGQTELAVFLHHKNPLPVALANALNTLDPSQVHITAMAGTLPQQVPALAPLSLGLENNRQFLRVKLAYPGGFGLYRLTVDAAAIDHFHNGIEFSFKADCPTELDCAEAAPACPPGEQPDFPVDYRARDFWSLRQALLDFAAQRQPDWQDRLEADLGMVIVELISALGDEFAYAQDRIARETHFDTATQRRSLRHLARLVDYPIDNGAGAVAWLNVTANAAGTLAAGLAVSDANAQVVFELGRGLADKGKTFAVSPGRNKLSPYIWDEDATCLPKGSTTLTLKGHCASEFIADGNIDPAGKWILLATYPTAPEQAERRLLVRVPPQAASESADLLNGPTDVTEIRWEQPTPFDLDLTTLWVHGNLLPATSGQTLTASFRVGNPKTQGDANLPKAIERIGADAPVAYGDTPPGAATPKVKYLFSLPGSDKTPLVWLDSPDGGLPRPEIRLTQADGELWDCLPALVGEETAAATDKVFTLEDGSFRRVFGVERSGQSFEFHDYAANAGSSLRFGDGEFGMSPADGMVFQVEYRLGNGRLTNVPALTLTRFLAGPPAIVDAVTNPLPAQGGRDPEPDDAIRVNAPEAFRAIAYRAVRPEDFDEIVQRELPWVQRSGTAQRWTGSWPTLFITPDPRDSTVLAASRRQELERLAERVRQAGREVKVQTPRYANLDLEIHVCVAPDAYAGEVKAQVLAALFGDDSLQGFFHPDRFSFGTPLSRAALLATLQAVPGVRAVEQMFVRRRGLFDWRPFDEFMLAVGKNEVIQVANNRQFPEYGAVKLVMEGGA